MRKPCIHNMQLDHGIYMVPYNSYLKPVHHTFARASPCYEQCMHCTQASPFHGPSPQSRGDPHHVNTQHLASPWFFSLCTISMTLVAPSWGKHWK